MNHSPGSENPSTPFHFSRGGRVSDVNSSPRFALTVTMNQPQRRDLRGIFVKFPILAAFDADVNGKQSEARPRPFHLHTLKCPGERNGGDKQDNRTGTKCQCVWTKVKSFRF